MTSFLFSSLSVTIHESVIILHELVRTRGKISGVSAENAHREWRGHAAMHSHQSSLFTMTKPQLRRTRKGQHQILIPLSSPPSSQLKNTKLSPIIWGLNIILQPQVPTSTTRWLPRKKPVSCHIDAALSPGLSNSEVCISIPSIQTTG